MSGQYYGILIANSKFPKEPKKLNTLRCPENDVEGLAKILASNKHGLFDTLIKFSNDTSHKVLRKINKILKQSNQEDLVLVYYSGHGKLDRNGKLHLATVETEFSVLESTSIPVERIHSFINVSSCTKIVLILDCCFAGAAKKDFLKSSLGDVLQVLSGQGRGIYIITASTETQVAKETESGRYSLLTKHIIDGIKEGKVDSDDNGLISVDNLYKYVHKQVLQESSQEPERFGETRGDLFIARSGKIAPKSRNEQIQILLSRLWDKRIISDDILDISREVLSIEPNQLTGMQHSYNDLLNQLAHESIEIVEFIRQWNRITSQPVPAEPEVPFQRHKSSSTTPNIAIEKTISNRLDMKFILILPGRYMMGSPPAEKDRNADEIQHEVILTKAFYLQTTLVAQGHWEAVMGNNPSYFKDCGSDCPVDSVSWEDVLEFIRKLIEIEDTNRYRLPTEAEWEYACRGGTSTIFSFGDNDTQLEAFAFYKVNSIAKTHSVAQKKSNTMGLYDMHGNVWEWCQDRYGDYSTGLCVDPEGPQVGNKRVLRGGSWLNPSCFLRSACRNKSNPTFRDRFVGFRLVCDLD